MEARTSPKTSSDEAAVVATAIDYFEGWFDGDVARMRRALHPELAKRGLEQILDVDPDRPRTTTAERMLELTARGEGKGDGADRRIDVAVEDVHGDIASVTVRSAVYREYVHLVRTRGRWQIVNALWSWTSHDGPADESAIVDVALDYFEGWFDGDAERMRRALHPALVKRPGRVDHSVHGTLGSLTASEMIARTTAGIGRTRDVPDRAIDVDVADTHRDIASATVRSAVYHEYLHLVRTHEGWKIVNTLWQWQPGHERSDADT